MKKLFLLSLISIFCFNLNAQSLLRRTGKTMPVLKRVYQKQTTRANTSEWYNYGFDLSDVDPNSKYYAFHLFPDSTVKVNYANGVLGASTHSIGEVFDPADQNFTNSSPLTQFMSYTVDSISIPYLYSRPQDGAPDTLIIQIYNSSAIETADQAGATYATVQYDYLKRKGKSPIMTRKVLLTNADISTDGTYLTVPVGVSVTAGKKVAATVTYFPGNPFTPGDTLDTDLNPSNKINDFQSFDYYISHEGPAHYFNNELLVDPSIRYNYNDLDWNGYYYPGTAYTGFAYYYDINFKITYDAALLSTDKEAEGITATVFPNPSNGLLTIIHPQEELVINITDVTGRVLMSKISSNKLKDEMDISNLSNGTYFCEIKSADKTLSVKKVVLMK